MRLALPGFVQKTATVVWGKKWYVVTALGLIFLGSLAAFVTEHTGGKPATTVTASADKRAAKRAPSSAVAGVQTDEETKDASAEAGSQGAPAPSTNAPAQNNQPSRSQPSTPPAADPGDSNNGAVCTSDVTIAGGPTSVSLQPGVATTLNFSTSQEVVWTYAASHPTVVASGGSSVGTDTSFTVEGSVPGSYTVTLGAEDGGGSVCDTQVITVVIEEAPEG